jgi:hypothetical protein
LEGQAVKKISPSELRYAIESKHCCRAGLANSVFVKLTFAGSTLWEGVVHVFDLAGHPKANQAYAWAHPIAGTDRWELFSMLHVPPITSAAEAVRAAVMAEVDTA